MIGAVINFHIQINQVIIGTAQKPNYFLDFNSWWSNSFVCIVVI